MDKDQARQAIKVLEGFIEGKTVQYYSNSKRGWIDDDDPDMAFQYRLKPEPKTFWLCTQHDFSGAYTYTAVEPATPDDGSWIKVREVIDEQSEGE